MSSTCLRSGGNGTQTSNGTLSVTDSAYNGARPVESNHQEAETIGSSDAVPSTRLEVMARIYTCVTFVEMNIESASLALSV